MSDEASNPFIFDPTRHGYDSSTEIGDFNKEEAYEMGVSAGWGAGKTAVAAEIASVVLELDEARGNGTLFTYGQIQSRLRQTIRALSEKDE